MRQNTLTADLIMMPYNYLLDAGSRQPYQVRWPNSIIIFDEAHNIESVASEAWSLDIPTSVIATVMKELSAGWERRGERGVGGEEGGGGGKGGSGFAVPPSIVDFTTLMEAFKKLEELLDAVPLSASGGGGGGR